MATRICKVEEIPVGKAIRVRVGDHAIAIAHTPNGEIRALDDKCSHGEVSLSEGFVDNESIECWAHGAKFAFADGTPTLPAYEPVAVYEVIIDNGEIFLEIDAA